MAFQRANAIEVPRRQMTRAQAGTLGALSVPTTGALLLAGAVALLWWLYQ